MLKKKQKVSKAKTLPQGHRLNTEIVPIHQPIHFTINQDQYINREPLESKKVINCKQLRNHLGSLKNFFQTKLETLLINQQCHQQWQLSHQLLQTESFKTRSVSKVMIQERYSMIIQGVESLLSKLINNEKFNELIYLNNEEDFLLVFKHLFGKPYTLCNFPHFRKILEAVWFTQIFPDFTSNKISENLELWVHGIEIPINPAAIGLHRLVFTAPQNIKKYVSFIKNDLVYSNINQSDCLGLTPLLLAAHINNCKAYQYILKSGASVFQCPLVVGKVPKTMMSRSKKDKQKQSLELNFGMKSRLQFNCLQIVLVSKQYQQIANLLVFEEKYKIKQLKKFKQKLLDQLLEIPDCCFQIHWKILKGFLTFKELPKDNIIIHKKGGFLRIDFHTNDIEKLTPLGFYSILLKCSQDKLQYYYIDHRNKKVVNLMREINYQKLKTRYDQFVANGCVQDLKVSSMKLLNKSAPKIQTNIHCQFYYENISKGKIYNFKNRGQYQKELIDCELINYKALEASEIQAIINQSFLSYLPKVKSRIQKSSNTIAIQWARQQKLTLKNFASIFSILDMKSILFLKLEKVCNLLVEYGSQKNSKYQLESFLPKKVTISGPLNICDTNLEIEIKNLVYWGPEHSDDFMFDINYSAKQMGYEDNAEGLQSLQQTLIMDESYTINISGFLGKTQKLREIQDQEANRKFEELLNQEINRQSDEEDSPNVNNK